jgi:hypothetical protein
MEKTEVFSKIRIRVMVLDRKHFDDLDDFCDFDDKIETSCEGDMGENGPSHPLSWRRIIIEKAVSNVKKAAESKTDLKASYKKGDLVFDEESSKFGRVIESKPGFLNLSLLAGGKVIRRDINQLDFVRENRQKLTLKEMSDTLFLSEIEVITLLNQVELATDKEAAEEKAGVKVEPSVKAKALPIKAAKKTVEKKKPMVKTKAPKDMEKRPIKANVKLAAKKKDKVVVKKKMGSLKETLINFTKLLPKGATTDPVMDPNGYIQQNFLLMNNRELATATGLSEHTIRRKLGEWNLKRKDFVNKA